MSSGGPSTQFLVAGILVNVVLTGLVIWWLFKQGTRKPPPGDREADR